MATRLASGSAYRPGELLTAASLRDGFARAEARQGRHLAMVHGVWGIVEGFEVTRCDDPARPSARVAPGLALDASGRWIGLDRAVTVPLPTPRAGAVWHLAITADHPPRWVSVDAVGSRAHRLVLATLDDGGLHVPISRTAAIEALPRAGAGRVNVGQAPAVETADGWTARIETSAANLSGPVVYFVEPTYGLEGGAIVGPPAGASLSVVAAAADFFIVAATGWPLRSPNPPRDAPSPTAIPAPLVWIGLELGRRAPTGEPTSAESVMPSVAASKPIDPFALPASAGFRPEGVLTAGALNDALGRLAALHALHNRLMHPWGIVVGLTVTVEPGGEAVRVAPGAAIDIEGRELLWPEPDVVAPPDATRAEWVLVLTRPTDGITTLGWRDPAERSGLAALQPGFDIVLARLTFEKGQIKTLSSADRRNARPTAPSLDAGSTPRGRTTWALWPDDPQGGVPRGLITRVSFSRPRAVAPVVVAQLAGDRSLLGSIVAGPTFVTETRPDGFDFVVLLSNLPFGVGVPGNRTLAMLLDQVRERNAWHVGWLAVSPEG